MKQVRLGMYLTSIIAMVWMVGCAPQKPPEKKPETPSQVKAPVANDFVVANLSGDASTLRLSDYAGKVVLIDFWATWCPPCKAELPTLNKMYQDLKDRGFTIIGLSVDQGEQADIAEAVKAFGLSYPVGLANEDVQKAYGGIRAVPTKFLLDKEGGVRQHYVGLVPENRLRQDIEALLQ
jgi:thiol-disulfide isomerase/thioredoxin